MSKTPEEYAAEAFVRADSDQWAHDSAKGMRDLFAEAMADARRAALEFAAEHVESYATLARSGTPAEAIVEFAASTLRSESFRALLDEAGRAT